MATIRGFFGDVVTTKGNPTPAKIKESTRSRFKNPAGGGEPCSVADRQGDSDILDRLVTLSNNLVFRSVEMEKEYIGRRLQLVSKKSVLENLPGFLQKFPNYHPVQAIDELDGYKQIIF